MDLYCPLCGIAVDFGEVENVKNWQKLGCKSLGFECDPAPDEADKTRASVADALYDILGDDIDGAAAMLEDYEMMEEMMGICID